MAKQFDDGQVAVLQRIIREHEYGLGPGTGEVFAPTQKPLTYDELAELRKLLHQHRAVDAGVKSPSNPPPVWPLLSPKSRAGDTYPADRPKTSTLLTEAAEAIDDLKLGRDTIFGKHWQKFIAQLRDRAWAFKDIEDMP